MKAFKRRLKKIVGRGDQKKQDPEPSPSSRPSLAASTSSPRPVRMDASSSSTPACRPSSERPRSPTPSVRLGKYYYPGFPASYSCSHLIDQDEDHATVLEDQVGSGPSTNSLLSPVAVYHTDVPLITVSDESAPPAVLTVEEDRPKSSAIYNARPRTSSSTTSLRLLSPLGTSMPSRPASPTAFRQASSSTFDPVTSTSSSAALETAWAMSKSTAKLVLRLGSVAADSFPIAKGVINGLNEIWKVADVRSYGAIYHNGTDDHYLQEIRVNKEDVVETTKKLTRVARIVHDCNNQRISDLWEKHES